MRYLMTLMVLLTVLLIEVSILGQVLRVHSYVEYGHNIQFDTESSDVPVLYQYQKEFAARYNGHVTIVFNGINYHMENLPEEYWKDQQIGEEMEEETYQGNLYDEHADRYRDMPESTADDMKEAGIE